MHTNPYQVTESLAERALTSAQEANNCGGIPLEDFAQYRRAVIGTSGTFFLMFGLMAARMFRISIVDGAVASIVPITMLAATVKVVHWRTPADTDLSLSHYRNAVWKIRHACILIGPVTFALGIAQLIWVPTRWQIFILPCIICGPMQFCCAFLFPRIAETE